MRLDYLALEASLRERMDACVELMEWGVGLGRGHERLKKRYEKTVTGGSAVQDLVAQESSLKRVWIRRKRDRKMREKGSVEKKSPLCGVKDAMKRFVARMKDRRRERRRLEDLDEERYWEWY